MAKNSFVDNSLISSQFKKELSKNQRFEIDSIKDINGSLGFIRGNSIQSLKGATTNNNESKLNISSGLAGSLKSSGLSQKSASKMVSNLVSPSVNNKRPINEYVNNNIRQVDETNRKNAIKPKSPIEKIKDKKDRLLGEVDGNYAGFQFPSDLRNEGTGGAHTYIRLKFEEYVRGGAFSAGSVRGGPNIYLPLPENYNQAFSVQYAQIDTGFMGEILKSIGQTEALTQLGQGQLGDALSSVVAGAEEKNLGTVKQAALDALKRAGYASLSSADETVGGLAGSISGQIPNPHPTVFFKGLNLRTFQWNWRFVPRNEQDSENLRQIIFLIKKLILPFKKEGFLAYPNFVTPEVMGRGAERLGNFKRCLVSNFNVNYTGEGTGAFFRDGAPVSVMCSIEFTEIENFTSEDVFY